MKRREGIFTDPQTKDVVGGSAFHLEYYQGEALVCDSGASPARATGGGGLRRAEGALGRVSDMAEESPTAGWDVSTRSGGALAEGYSSAGGG